MRDHDHAGARIRQLAQHLQHKLAVRGVERAGRLVGEHHRRTHEQRTAQGDALLFATGQGAYRRLRPLAKTEPGQQLRDLHVVGLAMGERERQHHVLLDRQIRHGIVLLEHETDMPANEPRTPFLIQCVDVGTADGHPPGIGPVQSGQHIQQRGLACAGRTDDRRQARSIDIQRNIIENSLRVCGSGGGSSIEPCPFHQSERLNRCAGILPRHEVAPCRES